MNRQIYCFVVICILLTQVIFAQEATTMFDPDNPSSFDYDTGDYTTITDWSKVEWDKIPASRISEVPSGSLVYSEINTEQRLEMNVEQIAANLENIGNLATDVSEERARDAIRKEQGIQIESLGNGAKIEKGVLKATFGEEGSFAFSGKTAWKIQINEQGIVEVLEPREIAEASISNDDHFIVTEETVFTTGDGTTITVSDVSFKDKKLYIAEDGTAIIDHVAIEAEDGIVGIFTDGNKHDSSNYVSINTEQKKFFAHAEAEDIGIDFQQGNVFFDTDDDDKTKFVLYRGSVQIARNEGGFAAVQYSLDNDLVTGNAKKTWLFRVSSDSNRAEMWNDGRIKWSATTDDKTSSPFTFVAQDKEGKNLLGGKEIPTKIVFDNTNTLYLVAEDYVVNEETDFAQVAEDSSVFVSSTLKNIAAEREKGQGGILATLEYWSSAKGELSSILKEYGLLKSYKGMIDDLTPAMRDSLSTVTVDPSMCGGSDLACVHESKSVVYLSGYESEEKSKDTFVHEASHVLTNKIQKKEVKEYAPLVEYVDELEKKYDLEYLEPFMRQVGKTVEIEWLGERPRYFEIDEVLTSDEEKKLNILIAEQQEIEPDSLRTRWMLTAGEVYGKEYGYGKEGCISNYGCDKNWKEDLAEFTAKANVEPEEVQVLVKTDERYAKKVELLHEYGFITEERYKEIMRVEK